MQRLRTETEKMQHVWVREGIMNENNYFLDQFESDLWRQTSPFCVLCLSFLSLTFPFRFYRIILVLPLFLSLTHAHIHTTQGAPPILSGRLNSVSSYGVVVRHPSHPSAHVPPRRLIFHSGIIFHDHLFSEFDFLDAEGATWYDPVFILKTFYSRWPDYILENLAA